MFFVGVTTADFNKPFKILGFVETLDDALNAVYEYPRWFSEGGKYDFLLIEEYRMGLGNEAKMEKWFEFKYLSCTFEEIEKPSWVSGKKNFLYRNLDMG